MVGFRGHGETFVIFHPKLAPMWRPSIGTYLHSNPHFRQQLMLVASPSRDGRAMGDCDQPTLFLTISRSTSQSFDRSLNC
jgi:hypothetical protein